MGKRGPRGGIRVPRTAVRRNGRGGDDSVVGWRSLEGVSAGSHRYLTAEDRAGCFYFANRERRRDRSAGEHSEAYRVVSDLKLPPRKCDDDHRALARKWRACLRVCSDLEALFGMAPDARFGLIPAPTSRRRDDPGYDSRLEVVCCEVARRCPNVVCLDLLTVSESGRASCEGGAREAVPLAARLEVFPGADLSGLDYLVVFDDVLSSGAHFKACQYALLEAYGVMACGAFWARSVGGSGGATRGLVAQSNTRRSW